MIALANDRKSASEIGALLGVTRNAVIGKLNRLRAKGLAPPSVNLPHKAAKAPVYTSERRVYVRRPAPKVEKIVYAEPTGAHITRLIDAGAHQCRWINGDYRKGDADQAWLCGAPQAPNSAYCPHHRSIAVSDFKPRGNLDKMVLFYARR
jgi:hypothetical protein